MSVAGTTGEALAKMGHLPRNFEGDTWRAATSKFYCRMKDENAFDVYQAFRYADIFPNRRIMFVTTPWYTFFGAIPRLFSANSLA
jgi:hypothetical protein